MLGIASSESGAGAEPLGRASFLSLSTIQTAVLVILAHADQLKRGNLNGGKIRFSLPLPWARRCRWRDDTARHEPFAGRCGRPQARRSAESEDYARGHRNR